MIISCVLKSSKLEFDKYQKLFMRVFAHLHLHESCDAKQFWVLFVCCKFEAKSIAFAGDSILLPSDTSLWHYLWHFPPQRDRKYNRAVTKAPSAGQCGHFCGITKNDKQSERERGTDTFIKHKRVSADERVPLSQRISEFLNFLKCIFPMRS